MKTTLILSAILAVGFAAPHPRVHRRQNNLQPFSGALGGIEATPIVDSGNPDRPFQVKQDTFVNLAAALQRSCDQQFNACANAANGGDETLSVGACSEQKDQCGAASAGASNNNANAGPGNANAENEQEQEQEAPAALPPCNAAAPAKGHAQAKPPKAPAQKPAKEDNKLPPCTKKTRKAKRGNKSRKAGKKY